MGCGSHCPFFCPFGFPCDRADDCISKSCTSGFCDVGSAAKFRILPNNQSTATVQSTITAPLTTQTPSMIPFGNSNYSGRITYYGDYYNTGGRGDPPPIGPENGGWYGSCYLDFGIPKNWNKFAALNQEQYQKLGLKSVCGKCVKIWNGNRSTIVQIVDMCPSCKWGALDISHQGMAELVGSYDQATFVGFLPSANWSQVDCSTLNEEAFFTVVHGK